MGTKRDSGFGLPRLRFWNTLAFRVALVVNITVITVLGAFALTDYRRERALLISQEIERLREEARVLAVARAHFPQTDDFQQFIDDFCRQMSSAASPGHHVVIFDKAGDTLLRAHARSNPDLEAKMAASGHREVGSFRHDGVDYLSVGVETANGATVSVAQSSTVIRNLINRQGISRATSMGILVVLIVAVTTFGLLIWLRRPLRELVDGVTAVGRGHFDVRVGSRAAVELKLLATGINRMAESLRRVENRRQSEMRRAKNIQQGLLPSNNRRIEGFEAAAAFLPADSVGGDLYDIVPLPDGSTLLVVLDVSGHGVPAALYTALLRTVLHHQASATSDIVEIATAMNRELWSIASAGEFATCFLARIMNSQGTIEYLSAGHDAAIVVHPNGSASMLTGGGLPLGIEEEAAYQILRAPLAPGDRLFLFTDGLHEVLNGNERPLGRTGLAALLTGTSRLGLEQQIEAVIQKVRSFQRRSNFDDDVTLLGVGRV